MSRSTTGLLSLVLLSGVLAACSEGNDRPELTVAAASSLRPAFEAYAEEFEDARVRLSFAGSDSLAAQIRQGVRPDIYAAANTTLPSALFAEGLVEVPVAIAVNSLVVAVPAESEITSLDELAQPGTTIALGSPSVPVGAYAREVLSRLPDGGSTILANVRSEEPNVTGVIGKLTQGAADAGLVDTKAERPDCRFVRIAALAPGCPARERPFGDVDRARGVGWRISVAVHGIPSMRRCWHGECATARCGGLCDWCG